jgi:hypothetical protein
LFVVSTAIGNYDSEDISKAKEWEVAIDTISSILSNVLAHPQESKYYAINTSNPKFNKK